MQPYGVPIILSNPILSTQDRAAAAAAVQRNARIEALSKFTQQLGRPVMAGHGDASLTICMDRRKQADSVQVGGWVLAGV